MPAYDKQSSIYDSVQALLDRGIVDIGKNAGLPVAADDYFYGGKMANWKKLAYSLKARYYMHLIKAPGHDAVTQSNLALTALQSGMTSTADEWKFVYPGGATSQNAWYTIMLAAFHPGRFFGHRGYAEDAQRSPSALPESRRRRIRVSIPAVRSVLRRSVR